MYIIEASLNWLKSNPLMICLIDLITIDIILGSSKAILEKKFNSSIGKKGIIIKITMILVAICSVGIDYMLNINFLFLLPDEVKSMLNIGEPGLCEIIILLLILYELTSICKNWSALGLPGAQKLKRFLEKFSNEMK